MLNINETVNIDILIEYGNKLKGAEVYFREDWGCYYFSLIGKCFGMLTNERITLKGNPIENELLREKHQSITPGYYANKVHWNTIDLTLNEFNYSKLTTFIHKSYELVLNGLTKKDRTIIQDMHENEEY